jgi:hypothetical protein
VGIRFTSAESRTRTACEQPAVKIVAAAIAQRPVLTRRDVLVTSRNAFLVAS